MNPLSVIIPTRNRADLLQAALQSLQSQTLPAEHYEVLVIDNGSTDPSHGRSRQAVYIKQCNNTPGKP